MRRSALLLVVALLALASGKRRNSQRRGGRRCGPNCLKCSRTNSTICETCRSGFALTPELQCGNCAANCRVCTTAGPGGCDSGGCLRGHTLSEGQCGRCAEHCLQCDQAGPGGCNECGDRRMLEVRLDVSGEVHECHSCGPGCRKCSMEEGCVACDTFYYRLNSTDCALSWMRIGMLVAIVAVLFAGSVYCCIALSEEEDSLYDTRAKRGRQADPAQVVRAGSDDGVQLRRRASGRQDASPPRGSMQQGPDYPLMPGYSGIPIVDTLPGQQPQRSARS